MCTVFKLKLVTHCALSLQIIYRGNIAVGMYDAMPRHPILLDYIDKLEYYSLK